ncbi:MAG: PTS sugar transporter subunit IIA [Alphaproteobacteria bacterium]|nr:PTS sugar transporter subunit IIA [Alphaproteobacteria bacterium]
MYISDILSEDMILLDVSADNKRHLLMQVADFVAEKQNLDKNAVFEAILERENLGTTGYGGGVAFPHARLTDLPCNVTAFVRLREGVDYDALDNQKVDLLAFLVSSEQNGEDHLQALAAFSRVLKNADICQKIRLAKNAHEIYVALQN